MSACSHLVMFYNVSCKQGKPIFNTQAPTTQHHVRKNTVMVSNAALNLPPNIIFISIAQNIVKIIYMHIGLSLRIDYKWGFFVLFFTERLCIRWKFSLWAKFRIQVEDKGRLSALSWLSTGLRVHNPWSSTVWALGVPWNKTCSDKVIGRIKKKSLPGCVRIM